MSEPKLSALESMSAVMGIVRGLGKHQTNQHFRFNFRGIDDVMNAVGPALREVGAVITPRVLSKDRVVGQNGKGGAYIATVVEVEYTWHGPDGSTITSSAFGESFDTGDKSMAKAMSVAYRTYLLQALCLPTDEPDPDAQSYPAPPVPEADAARDRLRELCKQSGIDLAGVAAWFEKNHGEPLKDTQNVAAINELIEQYTQRKGAPQ
ncbi:ERF family protein [Dermabacteraceae bacterium TAE3-ERU27]|nr:ERF family protein [Dermabacteraceae bacterium TAE3-ERU27]